MGNIDFLKFHKTNPHIFALFQREVFKAINAGKNKLSARTIIEFIRWNFFIEIEDNSDIIYKINNNYIPYYARMFMKNHPEYEEIFELRGDAVLDFEPVQGEFF